MSAISLLLLLFFSPMLVVVRAGMSKGSVSRFLVENLRTCGRGGSGERMEQRQQQQSGGPFRRPWMATLVDAQREEDFCSGALVTKRQATLS